MRDSLASGRLSRASGRGVVSGSLTASFHCPWGEDGRAGPQLVTIALAHAWAGRGQGPSPQAGRSLAFGYIH